MTEEELLTATRNIEDLSECMSDEFKKYFELAINLIDEKLEAIRQNENCTANGAY